MNGIQRIPSRPWQSIREECVHKAMELVLQPSTTTGLVFEKMLMSCAKFEINSTLECLKLSSLASAQEIERGF